jgi:hypothetical protein
LPNESKPGPNGRRHLVVLACAYLLVVPVYLLDYGPPWRRPAPVPAGGNWITLDLTGLFFAVAMIVTTIFAVVSSLALVRAKRLNRRMSFAAYLMSLSITVAIAGGLWAMALVD